LANKGAVVFCAAKKQKKKKKNKHGTLFVTNHLA
jgi:hypothetical protein